MILSDGQPFDIPGNPQQSNGIAGPNAMIGRYQFMRLPCGDYLITAEIPDAAGITHRTNLSVNVIANTMTAGIVIPDLVIATASTPGPSHSTTSSPSPSAGAAPASSSMFSAGLALPVLGICALMLADRKRK